MRTDPPLSVEAVEAFFADGYLIVEDAIPHTVIQSLTADLEQLIDDVAHELHDAGEISDTFSAAPFERRLASLSWAAGRSLQPRLTFTANRRRGVYDFITDQSLAELLVPLLGTEIRCHPTMHVRPKLPHLVANRSVDFSRAAALHQDAAALSAEADNTLMITSWIPLVPVTEAMGPVELFPTMHLGGLRHHTYQRGVGLAMSEPIADATPISVPLDVGSVLLLHGKTPHRSGPNTTQIVRWSVDLRWHDPAQPSGRPLPGLTVRSDRSDPTGYDQWLTDWSHVDPTSLPRIVDRWIPSTDAAQ